MTDMKGSIEGLCDRQLPPVCHIIDYPYTVRDLIIQLSIGTEKLLDNNVIDLINTSVVHAETGEVTSGYGALKHISTILGCLADNVLEYAKHTGRG